jgi:hypothetical protein
MLSTVEVFVDEVSVGRAVRRGSTEFPIPLGHHQIFVRAAGEYSKPLDLTVIRGDVYELAWWIQQRSQNALLGSMGFSTPWTIELRQLN